MKKFGTPLLWLKESSIKFISSIMSWSGKQIFMKLYNCYYNSYNYGVGCTLFSPIFKKTEK